MIEGNMGQIVDVGDVNTHDLIKNEMCNCNTDVEKWEFVGILRGVHLGFSSNVWVVTLDNPPPKLCDLIDFESSRWVCLHGGIKK